MRTPVAWWEKPRRAFSIGGRLVQTATPWEPLATLKIRIALHPPAIFQSGKAGLSTDPAQSLVETPGRQIGVHHVLSVPGCAPSGSELAPPPPAADDTPSLVQRALGAFSRRPAEQFPPFSGG